ncbi:hypothetical protein C8A01DRAFT_15982 [Parachaetomium inaequale]|uniref:F-box domain-containing protein n=1 Tax=Parachaetomium inaequale TaxID=2588326 RepID=A0AAN6SRY1_9PEZI|nr:hypothetical protein C8A01DRAFT_15982 [Parachaetomium inaequale]
MLLQEFPSEVLIHILASAGSLPDLRALASTSQRIYSLFQSEKGSLIYQTLANALGPVIDDALGLSHLQLLDPFSPFFFNDQLWDALARYQAYLAGRDHSAPRRLSLDFVMRLVRSYHIMSDLSRVYIACTFKLLDHEVRASCCPASLPMLLAPASGSEWLRVLRAHYRLQMALPIWLACRFGGGGRTLDDMRNANVSLFGQWKPWEIQQIFCVGTLYHRFRHRLHRIGDQEMKQEGRSDRVSHSLEAWREFVRSLRAADEAGWQAVLDEASRFRYGRPDYAGTEEENNLSAHQVRITIWGAHKTCTGRHEFPISLHFKRDHVTAVPSAWVDAFDGYYGYNFWGVVPSIRREGQATHGLWSLLGFVMWDAPRIGALKTSTLLWHGPRGWARSGVST